MSFFSITPRATSFLNSNNDPIPLKIIRGNGINLTPGFGVNVTDLNGGYKQFTNTNKSGDSFKIKIIFEKKDTYTGILNGVRVNKLQMMDYIIRNNIPVMVHTEAIDIPTNVNYLITKNPSREQNYKDDTIWELEFTTYVPLNLVKYANSNQNVLDAINKTKSKNTSSTKKASVKYQKLKDCGYKNLVYSKTKKVVECVKILQKVLVKNNVMTKKQVDGWYGKTTMEAVKKYQKNYNKKYKITNIAQYNTGGIFKVQNGKLISGNKNKTIVNKKQAKLSKRLSVTGKVDKATWIALYMGE